jgi:nucleotidyltransferase/DNA polymerase involved in DNA repair
MQEPAEHRTQPDQTGILCADVDAMFATIEAIERGLGPEVPILVGGAPEDRGVVSTASYAARRFGCHSAMPMAQALRLCPQAVRIQPRHDLYGEYSQRIMDLLRAYGPLEQMSIDEAYVDVGPSGINRELGRAVKAVVQQSTRLTVSVGLSANKLVSKIASGFQKPDGLTVVPAGGEAAFLAPLDIDRLLGVGPKTQARLAEVGIATCGDLTRLPLELLVAKFGLSSGRSLYDHARGIDSSAVVTHRDLKQVSQETTYVQDVIDRAKLWATLREQSDAVARRLRSNGLLARTVTLKLRYGDFQLLSRSATLPVPTDDPSELAATVARLMRTNWDRSRPVRLIGIGASRFVPSESWLQLALPLDN